MQGCRAPTKARDISKVALFKLTKVLHASGIANIFIRKIRLKLVKKHLKDRQAEFQIITCKDIPF